MRPPFRLSTIAALSTATVLLGAPAATAYDVSVSIDPSYGPVCQISDGSGAQSVMQDQLDINALMALELHNGLRGELASQDKNFSTVDRISEMAMSGVQPNEDELEAGNTAVDSIAEAAAAAGYTQQEVITALQPPEEQFEPTLLVPQQEAAHFLQAENIYEELANITSSQAYQLATVLSERGAEVGITAIQHLDTRLKGVSEGTSDAALRSALQACADGASTQDPAYDASVAARIPLTGGFGNGTAAAYSAFGGIALLLILVLTAGALKTHK